MIATASTRIIFRRRPTLLWALGFLLGGCGPHRQGDGLDASTDFSVADVGPRPPRPMCTETTALPIHPVPVDLLVLFDRSESMGISFGEGTRFSVEAGLLADLVPAYQGRIRFGFEEFPAHGDCPAGQVRGCCAEAPVVPVADHAAAAVTSAIAAAAPVEGNTPTAAALRMARQYFAGLGDGISRRFVLLSTDGRPSCDTNGQLADPTDPTPAQTACDDALTETDALYQQTGARLIVLGIGPDLETTSDGATDCLSELARHGQGARADGPPDFYTASHPEALERSLQQIFGAVSQASCLIELEKMPIDDMGVQVRLDGTAIARNRVNGWQFDPPGDLRHIRLFGDACAELDRFQVSTIEVVYGCPPCGEDRICDAGP